MKRALRAFAGVLCKDAWRYERALRSRSDTGWMRLCNRIERVGTGPDGESVTCHWDGSSTLHAPLFIPSWGRRLMERALRRDPVALAPSASGAPSAQPGISVLIVHRGRSRLPLLLRTLRSVAAQAGVPWECVVLEQSSLPEITGELPGWVRHVHQPTDAPDSAFNRSSAFNAAARAARAPLLLLHDNDMLMPRGYLERLSRLHGQGWQVINAKRFIFYLTRADSERVLALPDDRAAAVPPLLSEAVVQNLEAGGSLAVERDGFWSLGGMDESFVGWGGEDVEFWQRAATLRVWNAGFAPLVHLWHAPQPGKTPAKATPAMALLRERSAVPPERRILQLRALNQRTETPSP